MIMYRIDNVSYGIRPIVSEQPTYRTMYEARQELAYLVRESKAVLKRRHPHARIQVRRTGCMVEINFGVNLWERLVIVEVK